MWGASALDLMRRIRPLLFGALGALAVFLLLELGLRLLTDRDSRWNIRMSAYRSPDPACEFRVTPDYTFPGGEVTTNEHGFVAPRGIGYECPKGALRFLYLGDSVTFWPLAANYPAQLERLVEERTGIAVETVNTAVPGYASHNVRALFEHEVAAYDADALFIYVGWNDLGQFGPEGLPYKRHQRGYEVTPLQRLLADCYTIRFAYLMEQIAHRSRPVVDEPLTPEDDALYRSYDPAHFRDNLRAILRHARMRYPHVFLCTLAGLPGDQPLPEEMARMHFPLGMDRNARKLDRLVTTYNEVVRETVAGEGVKLVDLARAFDSPEARRHFTDSSHWDEGGARLAAEEIYRMLVERTDLFSTWPARTGGESDSGEVERAASSGG